ncbi:hypothetical protein AB4383_01850 [Vibrio breoganii]
MTDCSALLHLPLLPVMLANAGMPALQHLRVHITKPELSKIPAQGWNDVSFGIGTPSATTCHAGGRWNDGLFGIATSTATATGLQPHQLQ